MRVLDAIPVVPLLIAIAIGLNLRARRAVRRGEGPAEGSTFATLVRAAVRDPEVGGPFTSMKNGFGSIVLTIGGGSIRITAIGGGLSGVARAFGVDYEFEPSEVAMRLAEVRVGLSAKRERIVLSGIPSRRPRELAIVPLDGDLGRLQAALASAGVKVGDVTVPGPKPRSISPAIVILVGAIFVLLIVTAGNHAAMLVFFFVVLVMVILTVARDRQRRR